MDSQRQVANSAKSEVASLKDQVQKIKDKAPASQPPNDSDPVDAPLTDDESIVAVVMAYAHLREGSENARLNIQVSKKVQSFVRAGLMSDEGTGGYACVLKKSDGLWVVLFCGQGTSLQDELDAWGVPGEVLPS